MTRNLALLILLVVLVMLVSFATGCAETAPDSDADSDGVTTASADLIITNGLIYTVNEAQPWAQALAVKDGRILRVGDTDDMSEFIGEQTEVIDLQGRLVMPAFVDAHMHPALSAELYLNKISLHSVFTAEEYMEEIAYFVEGHPDLLTIEGAGFMRAIYGEQGPLKEWLDEIDSQRPIAITSIDGHSMWVNSKTLELAGIDENTPDPAGGVIKRLPGTNEPSGLLQEAAMGLVSAVFPSPSKEQYKEALLWLQEWFNAIGLTTSYDALVSFDPNYYMAYEELARENLLTVRYRGAWLIEPELGEGPYGGSSDYEDMTHEEAIEKGIELSQSFQTPYWQVNSFKFFADQVIEEETGLLKEPYAHRDDNWYGIKVWDTEVMQELFQIIDAAGFNLHIHQIGDAAGDYALTALEYVETVNGKRDSRHAFAHVQMLNPEDQERMAALEMTAILAPYWMVVDDYYWGLYYPYLGPERAAVGQYPAQSLLQKDINVATHSDFFVTEPDPGWAFYSFITRNLPQRIYELWYGVDYTAEVPRITDFDTPVEEDMVGPLGPEAERLTIEQAVRAMTFGGAYALFLERDLGSLEEGKLADLVVLDRNIFEVDIEEVADMEVLMTLFEGNVVFVVEGF
jgi:predicted amidohydrolase YtcJ